MTEDMVSLPRYDNPPLNEVVLGAQFTPPPSYGQINIGKVYDLYARDYPIVQEEAPLESSFEFFGGPPIQKVTNALRLMRGPVHSRYWFVSEDESELIQFQNDRLLHNWRVRDGYAVNYPHFESIASKFQSELILLSGFFSKFEEGDLEIQQIELSYINHIRIDDEKGSDPSSWLKLANLSKFTPEFCQLQFTEVVTGEEGIPFGRFTFDLKTAISPAGEPHHILSLTLRALPDDGSVAGCIKSLYDARVALSQRFESIVTDEAKEKWGRQVG